MKRKWIYEKNKGVFCTIRNVNNNTNFMIDGSRLKNSNFEHIFVRFLNALSAHITFVIYNYKTSYKVSENEYRIVMDSINNIISIKELLIERYKIEYLEDLIDLSIKLRECNLNDNNVREFEHLKGLINETLNKMKGNEKYPSKYQNDYYKISSCSSFRRMQDKAQVYPLENGDYSRTRLTHTLEVCGTSRMISARIDLDLFKNRNIEVQNLLECACLIHDIGNPPFGHYGESVIRKYYTENWDNLVSNSINKDDQMYYDFICFDGNAQSLRVMSKLQTYKEKSTLELSLSILGAIIKYPFDSTTAFKNKKTKFGYFYSEKNEIIERLKATKTFIEYYRNPISILLEASDDISYVISDIDDAVKKNIITREIFETELGKIDNNTILEDFKNNYYEHMKNNVNKYTKNSFMYTIKYLLIDLKDKLIKETAHCFVNNYDLIFNKGIEYSFDEDNYNEILCYKEVPSGIVLMWLKNVLIKNYVFTDKEVLKMELKGGQILYRLLDEFTRAILSLDIDENDTIETINMKSQNKRKDKELKLFNIISKNYIDVFLDEYKNTSEKEKIYYKLKLAVDYICGMSDSYILNLYKSLFLE